jgi:hypothetical protein
VSRARVTTDGPEDSVRLRFRAGACGSPSTVGCRSMSVATRRIIEQVFALSADGRYVAVRINDAVDLQQRAELLNC